MVFEAAVTGDELDMAIRSEPQQEAGRSRQLRDLASPNHRLRYRHAEHAIAASPTPIAPAIGGFLEAWL